MTVSGSGYQRDEEVEQRLIVTTAADVDDGDFAELSLRGAIGIANATEAVDAIGFASDLQGTRLELTSGPIAITAEAPCRALKRGASKTRRFYQRVAPSSGEKVSRTPALTENHSANLSAAYTA